MRPDNLPRDDTAEPDTIRLLARSDNPSDLAEQLWDLPRWAATGRELLDAATNGPTFADRFTGAAALVRHLRTDPALPDELLPDDWPATAMRRGYEDFRTEIKRLRTRGES
jgi:phenylacetic acid degradation operon negative regulatory protein